MLSFSNERPSVMGGISSTFFLFLVGNVFYASWFLSFFVRQKLSLEICWQVEVEEEEEEEKKKTKNGRRKEDFSTPTSLVMLILQGSPNGKSKEIVDENKYI
jgi:hypothetical protein